VDSLCWICETVKGLSDRVYILKGKRKMNLRKIVSKKGLCIVLAILMLLPVVAACGVFSARDPLERQDFLDVMEENGFEIVDYTNELTGELEDLVSLYLLAVSPSGSYQIEFIEFHTIAGAEAVFAGTMANAESLSGNARSHSSVNGVNHNTFRQTSAGLYSHLLRVDNTFIFVLGADADYRDEIRAKIDLIS